MVDSNPAGVEAWRIGCLEAWRLEAWILEPWRLVGLLAGWQDWIGLDVSGWQMGDIGGMERWYNTLAAQRGRRIVLMHSIS